MELDFEIFDAYNIRARLSPSIILLSPIVISVFLCFEKVRTLGAASITVFLFLAFANSVPIIQRRRRSTRQSKGKNNQPQKNRAAEMLKPSDPAFDALSKERYYKKLASLDKSFSLFTEPNDSEEFFACCESAVLYLRSRTRGNRLVLEENINYGFCRNLTENKIAGIVLSGLCIIAVFFGSLLVYDSISVIPVQNIFALAIDLLILVYWIFGVCSGDLDRASENYSKALIMSIDAIDADK